MKPLTTFVLAGRDAAPGTTLAWAIGCWCVLSATTIRGDLLVTSWGTSGVHGIYNLDEATGLPKPFPNDPSSFIALADAQGVMVGPDGLIYVASSNQASGVGSSIWMYDPLAPNVAATKTEFFAGGATRPVNPNG